MITPIVCCVYYWNWYYFSVRLLREPLIIGDTRKDWYFFYLLWQSDGFGMAPGEPLFVVFDRFCQDLCGGGFVFESRYFDPFVRL